MRFDRPQYGRRGFSGGNRSRPIKTVPKSVLLALIAASKAGKPTEQSTGESPAEIIPHAFTDYPLDRQLQDNIRVKGYTIPTPIQDQVIPAILALRDVIGIAQTGTGKTAAFLIPLIQKVTVDRAQRVLVVAPTRELAYQIHKELRDIARGLSIRSALLIGGTGEWRQKEDIRRDPHFVIATPGRLKDFIETRDIRLSGFRNVVLDEADRMVDIGFINDIKYFISLVPKERQSLFFSATISGGAGEILTDFVRNPVRVTINALASKATIMQEAISVPGNTTKLTMLHEMLKKKEFEKVLVFGRTKHGVQRLSDELAKRGVKSGAIHGNKRQNQRQYVLNQFTRSEIQILIATDLASRGLDIPNVSHVINYDLPESIDDYTHRIGRTGRANKHGVALTFMD